MPARAILAVEFVALFVLLPLGFRYAPVTLPPLPVLWFATAYCWLMLRQDASFHRVELWNIPPLKGQLASILGAFVAAAILISGCVYSFARPLLFSFIRNRPLLWTAFLLLYPVFSVYPQNLVYRAFLMHRYRTLFPAPALMIGVSALVFAFMHIVFRNPLAVTLTFFGGLLFAWRYGKTRSLAASSFEHALYGCFLFTIGLGQYFYHGRLPGSSALLLK